jgi:uncharacterized protein (TIGR02217 family)
MAFHEVRFPVNLSYDTRGGPGFSTSIAEGDSGSSERVSRWPNARRRYNAKYGIKSQDQLGVVIDFYTARYGPTIGFRFKDWNDYSTSVNHRDTCAPTDVLQGTATGSSGQFQLRTQYPNGLGGFIYRSITKPVAGTVRVARTPSGGGAAVEIFTFSFNTTTGLLTISSGLTTGDTITAGFEFDVPVQFGAELDEVLAITLNDFNRGEIPDIPLVEMMGDVASPDRFFYGDGALTPTSGTFSIDLSKRVWIFLGSVASKALLQDPTDLEAGGPYQHILNLGSATLLVRTFDDSALVVSLAAGKSALTVISPGPTGANLWAALSN